MVRRLLTILTVVLLGAGTCGAGWNPPAWERPATAGAEAPTNPAAVPLQWALGFYRGTISRVDGDRCPSHPTCSAYASEAIRLHGPALGCVLTAARLVGEADEAAFAPRIWIGDRWKVYSPVVDDLAFLRGRLEP